MKPIPELHEFVSHHLKMMQICFCVEQFDVELRWKKREKYKMEISVDYEYLEATIWLGKQVEQEWARQGYRNILLWLAHELTHILTGEVKMSKSNFCVRFHDERATEHISRLLYKLYEREYMQ